MPVLPTVNVYCGFGANANAEPGSWTNIASYHRSGVIRRGRPNEFQGIEAGTLSLILRNEDRRFDPLYSSGAYYPNVVPMTQIKVEAVVGASTYSLFRGYVEQWPQDWSGPKYSEVQLTAVDAFALLRNAYVSLITNTAYGSVTATVGSTTLTGISTTNIQVGDTVSLSGATYVSVPSGTTVSAINTTTSLTLSNAVAHQTGGTGAYTVTATVGIRPPAELTSARITRILDAAGWPAGRRSLDTGISSIQGATTYEGFALELINTVALTEGGLFFCDGSGNAVFHNRHRRFKSPYTTAVATFGDGGGTEIPYVGIGGDYSVNDIYNDAVVTREGSNASTYTDATSVSRYFKRTVEQSGLLCVDTNEAQSRAEYLVNRYKDPQLRFGRVEVAPGYSGSTSSFPNLLSREIADRVTVKRRPQAVGSAISTDQYVEAISHAWTARDWVTTFDVSPADNSAYWVLSDSVMSVLDSTTKLAY